MTFHTFSFVGFFLWICQRSLKALFSKCIPRKVSILKHLFLERCIVGFLCYECMNIVTSRCYHSPLSVGCVPTESDTDWTGGMVEHSCHFMPTFPNGEDASELLLDGEHKHLLGRHFRSAARSSLSYCMNLLSPSLYCRQNFLQ